MTQGQNVSSVDNSCNGDVDDGKGLVSVPSIPACKVSEPLPRDQNPWSWATWHHQ